MKTRSAYVKAPWQFEIRSIDLPDVPPSGHVLVRVEACGVCGTDVTDAAEKAHQWHPFGHEVAGVVERVGAGVEDLKAGQTVVLESSSFCGRCDVCRTGRVDLCQGGAPHFWKEPAMGFSDFMIAPACCVVPYEGLTPEVASLAEPAGVAYDVVKTADIQMGERVCLVGPGPIGLMAAALAIHRGASRMVCIGLPYDVRRLKVAADFGAETLAVGGSLADRKDLHRQFDHVLMTAPTQFIAAALALLDYGGIMTFIGIGTGSGEITFDANDFHFRKLQLRASFAAPAIYYPAVLRLLKAGVIPGDRMISHVLGLADIAKAVTAGRDEKETVLKVVVAPGKG